jgi:hypothetical protein
MPKETARCSNTAAHEGIPADKLPPVNAHGVCATCYKRAWRRGYHKVSPFVVPPPIKHYNNFTAEGVARGIRYRQNKYRAKLRRYERLKTTTNKPTKVIAREMGISMAMAYKYNGDLRKQKEAQ